MLRVYYLKRCWDKITIVVYICSSFAKQILPLIHLLPVELKLLSDSRLAYAKFNGSLL